MGKQPKKIFINISAEDETMLMEYQIKKLKEEGEKPTYSEIVNDAGFNIEKLREFLKETLKKYKTEGE